MKKHDFHVTRIQLLYEPFPIEIQENNYMNEILPLYIYIQCVCQDINDDPLHV